MLRHKVITHWPSWLQDAGFVVPDWLALADGSALEEHPREWGDMAGGWQRAACTVVDHRALETLLRDLDPALSPPPRPAHRCRFSRAPPSEAEVAVACGPRHCRSGEPLDVLGDHGSRMPRGQGACRDRLRCSFQR